MFGILGSGFGLYGYLPALLSIQSEPVVLPSRYASRLKDRPELDDYAGRVVWAKDENELLGASAGVVVAMRPGDQVEWISRCLEYSNVSQLLLEKPLAASPEEAARAFDRLIRSRKMFRLAYTFRYTDWGARLLRSAGTFASSGRISIRWEFMAHHFRLGTHNWKRSSSSGGGPLRFYGIHLIALLSEIGYCGVTRSSISGESMDAADRWTAIFTGPNLPECEVTVDTRSETERFLVEGLSARGLGQGIGAALRTPFDPPETPLTKRLLDPRVPILERHCRSLEVSSADFEWYATTNENWRRAEKMLDFRDIGEK